MKRSIIKIILCLLFFTPVLNSFAQRAKHGSLTVAAANTKVNEYTFLTSSASSGDVSITVSANSLNTNGRFSGPLQAGDLIMVIQMQGATINGTPSPTGSFFFGSPNDENWGAVINYNNCGNYEFAQVNSISGSTIINLDCGLTHSYDVSGKVQIVRVPRYNLLTVNSGSLTADTWNGQLGGILAVEVSGTTTISSGASINVTGLGFRGAQLGTNNGSTYGGGYFAVTNTAEGARKGEGIAGYDSDYDVFGGRYSRGAAANAGGGGNAHNCGGGGGSNAGNISGWNGLGNPDPTYTSAWNQEAANFAANTSSGGGRGGYAFSSSNQNASTLGPGNSAWGGDWRANHGGYGGRPLDYNSGRIFMGGGGGSGDQDNSRGGVGGNGGGICYILAYGNITGAGTVIANGSNGGDATSAVFSAGRDGAGGAGGGGTIIFNTSGTVNGLTANANGGTGGNQVVFASTNEAEGPGGGGGGGFIAYPLLSTLTATAAGGANGVTNSSQLSEFPPNGATRGGIGISNDTISNFSLIALNDTICAGNTATLSVSATGNVPSPISFNWYTTASGGSPIATGPNFTSPTLNSSTTYYVGSCPGTYRQEVTVIVGGSLSVTAISNDYTICEGEPAQLSAAGGTSFQWSPSSSLNSATGATVTANPTVTTTYTVTTTGSGCQATDTVVVSVTNLPTVNVSSNTNTICPTGSATLTASGATSYTWSPSGSLNNNSGTTVIASPSMTTTYTVTGTNSGCVDTSTIVIQVNNTTIVSASPSLSSICAGDSVLISASGATSYTWTPSTGLSINGNNAWAHPNTTTTYTVTGSNGSCSDTAVFTVNVNQIPIISTNPSSPSICPGTNISITASGASVYTWTPSATLDNTNSATVTADPSATTTYTVTGTSGSGCIGYDTVVVSVGSSITVTATTLEDSICEGTSTILTGFGAATYEWSPVSSLNASTGNSVSASPVITTTYTLTGTNGGCQDTSIIIINVTPSISVSANPINSVICSGDSVLINGSGASAYTWSPSTEISALGSSAFAHPGSTTTFTLTGSTESCTDTAHFIVSVNVPSSVTINATSSFVCEGDSISLTASGSINYLWSPSTGLNSVNNATVTASPSTTTTYTVTGTDNNGCSAIDTMILSLINKPIISVTAASDTICSGTATTLNATGAATYIWSPSSSLNASSGSSVTASPLVTETYTITGSTSCSDTTLFTLYVDSLPALNILVSQDTVCNGTSSIISASGADAYSWSPSTGLDTTSGNTVTATPGSTTTYTLTGSSLAGCQASETFTINVLPVPVISVTATASSICPGSSSILSASGGSNYSWSPASSLSSSTTQQVTASPSVTTTYTVIGSSLQCTDTAFQVITVQPSPVASINASSNNLCDGDSAVLFGNGGVNYQWLAAPGFAGSNSQFTVVYPLSTTTYYLVVSDGLCSDTATVNINVSSPVISLSANDTTICQGSSLQLQASGNATSYTWSSNVIPGGSTASATPSTNTLYTVIGSIGACSDTASLQIIVNQNPVVTFTSIIDTCNASISLTASDQSGVDYSWQLGDGNNASGVSLNHVYASAATYTIVLSGTDANGCVGTASQSIGIYDLFIADFIVSSQETEPGSLLTFTDLSSPQAVQWSWSFDDNNTSTLQNPSHTFTDTGHYTVTLIAVNSFGCSDTVIKQVKVVKPEQLNIPNIITPNGDGVNDLFIIKGVSNPALTIYNRWGEVVYETMEYKNNWDGSANRLLPDGVYFFILTMPDSSKYNGSVTIRK